MQSNVIQRQYDEVIASRYDFDPQGVTGQSLDQAVVQFRRHAGPEAGDEPVTVLDVGVGTGLFLEKLRCGPGPAIKPYGLDVSQKMIDVALKRIPDLIAAVDDAANLETHFGSLKYDLVTTHFITGFVPMKVLAPKIYDQLETGGHWSFVGGTRGGFPALQKKANSAPLKWFLRAGTLDVGSYTCIPADQDEVSRILREHGFRLCECEVYRPRLHFANFREFMDFAYFGGWLTPFIEAMGLHKANAVARGIMNSLLFPVEDHHVIVLALAEKV